VTLLRETPCFFNVCGSDLPSHFWVVPASDRLGVWTKVQWSPRLAFWRSESFFFSFRKSGRGLVHHDDVGFIPVLPTFSCLSILRLEILPSFEGDYLCVFSRLVDLGRPDLVPLMRFRIPIRL